MDNNEFDSLFADSMDDDIKFDAIFGSEEDGNLVDMVCGFNEAGECETDFDELHQEFDDAEPDDFEDDLVGGDTTNAPEDAEGSDDDPAIDLALGETFGIIHQTEDDATPDDFEQVVGPEDLKGAKDPEGTDDEPVVDMDSNPDAVEDIDMALGEDFDVIHQTADGACAKTLDDEVTGKETLNGAKDVEGTDDEPLVDLSADTGHKNPEHDETRIEDEFDKLMEEVIEGREDADDETDSEEELKGDDYDEDSLTISDDMDATMDAISAECNESEIVGPDADEEEEVEVTDYEDGDESLVDLVAGHVSAEE